MKYAIPWVWVAALLLAHQAATAGLTATIVDTVGDPDSMVLYGAGSFDVSIQVSTTTSLCALQLKLEETTSPGSDYFTLNSVAFSTPTLGVWSADSDYQFDPSPQTLNLSNSYTSGLIADLADDVDNGTGTGTFHFATLNITYGGPAAAGDYYLNLTEIVYGDMNYDEYAGGAGTAYQVQVVPEPGTAVLGLIGLSIVARARRDGSPQRRR
jgi:hypothetical protein